VRTTYIVQVRLQMDQRECFLEKDNEHAAGNAVVVEAVLVHVRLLSKNE
jgi:hypothetical protein